MPRLNGFIGTYNQDCTFEETQRKKALKPPQLRVVQEINPPVLRIISPEHPDWLHMLIMCVDLI